MTAATRSLEGFRCGAKDAGLRGRLPPRPGIEQGLGCKPRPTLAQAPRRRRGWFPRQPVSTVPAQLESAGLAAPTHRHVRRRGGPSRSPAILDQAAAREGGEPGEAPGRPWDQATCRAWAGAVGGGGLFPLTLRGLLARPLPPPRTGGVPLGKPPRPNSAYSQQTCQVPGSGKQVTTKAPSGLRHSDPRVAPSLLPHPLSLAPRLCLRVPTGGSDRLGPLAPVAEGVGQVWEGPEVVNGVGMECGPEEGVSPCDLLP